jgi:hypothetical protein
MIFFGITWLLALLLLLPKSQTLFLGNFATKAICYAMIGKNFIENPATFLKPTLDILVNANPSLHIVEWPWSAYVVGLVQKVFPGGFEFWGRASSFLLLPVFYGFFYSFLRISGLEKKQAEQISFFAAFFPSTILYFWSFQVDAWAMACLAATLYFLARWTVDGKFWNWVGLTLSFSLALLLKPHWAIFILPMGAWAALKKKPVWALVPGVFILFLWVVWNFYLAKTQSSIFFSLAMSFERNASIFSWWLDPSFYWKFLKQAPNILWGPPGAILILLGLAGIRRLRFSGLDLFFLIWMSCGLALFFLLPKKFYEANYYYLAWGPAAAFYAGEGFETVARFLRLGKNARLAALFLFAAISFFLAWRVISFVPENEKNIPIAADYVKKNIPKDSRVIASSGSSPILLYYCQRQGWALDLSAPNAIDSIRKHQKEGASYLITVDREILTHAAYFGVLALETRELTQNEDFTLLKLDAR